jgi:two-component system LytT family response regulator
MIKAIIIDDEQSAINVLSLLLNKFCSDDVTVLATTTMPQEADTLIKRHQPDLVFLDVEMPGMSGIDLARTFENPSFRIVFVTAYDAYAIEAFELSAIDYLLKPVGSDKVLRVIRKIKEDVVKHQHAFHSDWSLFEKYLKQNSISPDRKIGLGMADKIIFVSIGEIIYFEAQGAYTRVILSSGKTFLTSKPLGDYEDQLPSQYFFRIHHSYLINIHKIKEFQRTDGALVVMENNTRLEVSTRKKKDFLAMINDFII